MIAVGFAFGPGGRGGQGLLPTDLDQARRYGRAVTDQLPIARITAYDDLPRSARRRLMIRAVLRPTISAAGYGLLIATCRNGNGTKFRSLFGKTGCVLIGKLSRSGA